MVEVLIQLCGHFHKYTLISGCAVLDYILLTLLPSHLSLVYMHVTYVLQIALETVHLQFSCCTLIYLFTFDDASPTTPLFFRLQLYSHIAHAHTVCTYIQ